MERRVAPKEAAGRTGNHPHLSDAAAPDGRTWSRTSSLTCGGHSSACTRHPAAASPTAPPRPRSSLRSADIV